MSVSKIPARLPLRTLERGDEVFGHPGKSVKTLDADDRIGGSFASIDLISPAYNVVNFTSPLTNKYDGYLIRIENV